MDDCISLFVRIEVRHQLVLGTLHSIQTASPLSFQRVLEHFDHSILLSIYIFVVYFLDVALGSKTFNAKLLSILKNGTAKGINGFVISNSIINFTTQHVVSPSSS